MPDTSEKHKEFFDTTHLKKDLKGRSVRGGAVTMAAQSAKFCLQMGSTVVLARLLTPEDYGLIAMVAVITNFVMMFKDMGLSMATVQKAEINHDQISTLFWINVTISLAIMVVVSALAPVVVWFYGEPQLMAITIALAGVFIFGGLTVQHQALLRRQMRFGALALIEISAMLTGIITAIIAACCGAGYWAIVLMQLALAMVTAIGVWIACGWLPGLPKRGTGVRKMLGFGGNLTGFSLVNYFARNLDKILIGWRWDSGSLGFYSKAYDLLMLPLRQINVPVSSVAIPTLSRLQGEPERYRNYYLKAVSLIAFVTMPSVMFMIVMSKDIIHLVLGEQWTGAVKIFTILGVSALLQPVLSTNGWLHISAGRTDRMLKWGVFSSSFVIISFFIGLPYGAAGVATSYVIVGLMLSPFTLWYASKPTSVDMPSIMKVLCPTGLVTLLVGVTLSIFRTVPPILAMGTHLRIALCLGLSLVIFLSSYYLITGSFRLVREVFTPLVYLFRKLALIGKTGCE